MQSCVKDEGCSDVKPDDGILCVLAIICLFGQSKRKCRLLAVVATNKAKDMSENGKNHVETKQTWDLLILYCVED